MGDGGEAVTIKPNMAATSPFLKLFLGLHTSVYRASSGKIMSKLAGNDILLLTTTGRRSGSKRTLPLAYTTDGDTFVVTASNGGKPQHPGWYFNLKATPRAQVQVRAEVFDVVAKQVTGNERARIWAKLVAEHPQYKRYSTLTTREIPLMVLRRAITK